MTLLKMYSLLKMGIFHCYVWLPECISDFRKSTPYGFSMNIQIADLNSWGRLDLGVCRDQFVQDASYSVFFGGWGTKSMVPVPWCKTLYDLVTGWANHFLPSIPLEVGLVSGYLLPWINETWVWDCIRLDQETLPSGKLTEQWQWNIHIFNRKYIFKGSIFHCYVGLPECTWNKIVTEIERLHLGGLPQTCGVSQNWKHPVCNYYSY